MRRTLSFLFLSTLMITGCKTADEFSDAVPDPAAFELEVTGDPMTEGLSEDAVEGPVRAALGNGNAAAPEYLAHARNGVRAVNEGIRRVLSPILTAIATQGRRAQVGDERRYGPTDHGQATYVFVIKKLSLRSFGWALVAKPQGAPDSAYETVMGGLFQAGDLPRRGRGTLGVDLDKLARVDADFKGSGQMLVGFAHVLNYKVLAYGLHNFSPDVTQHDPVDAIFSGWRAPTGVRRVRLAVHANIADSPSAAEELVLVRSRWLPGFGGRADAVVLTGDVPQGRAVVANACWRREADDVNGFLLVRNCQLGLFDRDCTLIRTEGALANCAPGLETEELPAADPNDPSLEPDAPEMPTIPASMPNAI
jgi:hypothetical protein